MQEPVKDTFATIVWSVFLFELFLHLEMTQRKTSSYTRLDFVLIFLTLCEVPFIIL